MGTFLVRGVSRVSGQAMDVRVDARDGNEARDTAARNGLIAVAVAKLVRVGPKSGAGRNRGGGQGGACGK